MDSPDSRSAGSRLSNGDTDSVKRRTVGDRQYTANCPLCGVGSRRFLYETTDHAYGVAGIFSIVRCAHCSVFFVEDPLAPNRISEAYPAKTYYSFCDDPAPRSDLRQSLLTARYRRDKRSYLAKLFSKSLRAYPTTTVPGDVLDVGCGTGQRLARLIKAGWHGTGIEVNQGAAATARGAGLDVKVGVAESLPFDNDSFDAVIMSHSLEHCYEPRKAVVECFRVLRPGGELVVATPNAGSLPRVLFGPYWAGWEIPRHLVVFDRTSLVGLLASAGFGGITVKGSASGNGWIDSAINALRARGWQLPARRSGWMLLRRLALVTALATNWLPWVDEMEVVAHKGKPV